MDSQHYIFRHHSAEQWVDYFSNFYGPLKTVLASLDEQLREDLKNDLVDLCDEVNADAQSFSAPAEYIQVQVTLS